jgi:hypothetical protein
LVHSALIADVLARGAAAVAATGRITIASRLLEAADQAMQFHDEDYDESPDTAGPLNGYRFPAGVQITSPPVASAAFLPWNMQAQAARALLSIARAGGPAEHVARARAIGTSFIAHCRPTAPDVVDGGLWWTYSVASGVDDDASHAVLPILMLSELARAGMVEAEAPCRRAFAVASALLVDTDQCLTLRSPGRSERSLLPQFLAYAACATAAQMPQIRTVADALVAREHWLHMLRDDLKGVCVVGLAQLAAMADDPGADAKPH